jgi:hypothetical protein
VDDKSAGNGKDTEEYCREVLFCVSPDENVENQEELCLDSQSSGLDSVNVTRKY